MIQSSFRKVRDRRKRSPMTLGLIMYAMSCCLIRTLRPILTHFRGATDDADAPTVADLPTASQAHSFVRRSLHIRQDASAVSLMSLKQSFTEAL